LKDGETGKSINAYHIIKCKKAKGAMEKRALERGKEKREEENMTKGARVNTPTNI